MISGASPAPPPPPPPFRSGGAPLEEREAARPRGREAASASILPSMRNMMRDPRLSLSLSPSRFKLFLDVTAIQIRRIEIKRDGRLENMYFIVPDWCRQHWRTSPVREMR